jgi:catechol 2,3-dioxygenase-like lactoylglutathione lyase family enzyme
MSIRRVVPDIGSDRFDESRQFYADVLGFKVVMDLGSFFLRGMRAGVSAASSCSTPTTSSSTS